MDHVRHTASTVPLKVVQRGRDIYQRHTIQSEILSADIGVGAQSTLGLRHFLPENICMNN